MNKKQWIDMGYIQINSNEDEMDTIYKRFDNDNMWIVQFNEKVQEDQVGLVYLTKQQVNNIF